MALLLARCFVNWIVSPQQFLANLGYLDVSLRMSENNELDKYVILSSKNFERKIKLQNRN